MTEPYKFKILDSIELAHLPNHTKLAVQRQTGGVIPDEAVQLYIATNFVNSENGQHVWNRGFSIQMEQIPELIRMLERICGKSGSGTGTGRTGTFADLIDDA